MASRGNVASIKRVNAMCRLLGGGMNAHNFKQYANSKKRYRRDRFKALGK